MQSRGCRNCAGSSPSSSSSGGVLYLVKLRNEEDVLFGYKRESRGGMGR